MYEFEQYCDNFIKFLYNSDNRHGWISENEIYRELNIPHDKRYAIIHYLQKEGFIVTEETAGSEDINSPLIKKEVFCLLQREGMLFFNTNTFVNRKKGWELENKLKIQQSKLNQLELLLKRGTFLLALAAFILSVCNTCNQISQSKKGNQPPPDEIPHISKHSINK